VREKVLLGTNKKYAERTITRLSGATESRNILVETDYKFLKKTT
jgi:hypothetical protein